MSSAEILTRLAADKSSLRARISARRSASAEAIQTVVRPLAIVDGYVALWRNLPPVVRLAGATLSGVATRRWLGTRPLPTTLFRAIPALLDALRR